MKTIDEFHVIIHIHSIKSLWIKDCKADISSVSPFSEERDYNDLNPLL